MPHILYFAIYTYITTHSKNVTESVGGICEVEIGFEWTNGRAPLIWFEEVMGSIPSRVISKTLKMSFSAFQLSAQQMIELGNMGIVPIVDCKM